SSLRCPHALDCADMSALCPDATCRVDLPTQRHLSTPTVLLRQAPVPPHWHGHCAVTSAPRSAVQCVNVRIVPATRFADHNSRATLVGHVGIKPLKQHRNLIPESDQENQVHRQPGDPCR